ncbi:hypothetical protein AN958_07393 [Leucoagaricus sp. SymC.cos]|nr:hypothetical protein AN958_07393 [Leucoagaricus sp. SymC.cos]
MPVDVSLNTSELAALLLESLTYGIFLVLYFILLIIAFFKKNAEIPKKRYIIPIGTLMLGLATAHLITDFLRALLAFVPKNPNVTPTADKFFKKLSNPYAVCNWTLYGIQTLLGDGVLVWRCYVFCDKKWWTVVPGVILICFNTANLIILSRDDTLAVGAAFIHLTRKWMVSWICATAALQLTYSLAIVFQITRKFRGAGKQVNAVLKAIIESSALYTLFAVALLIAFEEASDADWVLLDMITPIVGISFCLIIIQLHIQFRENRSTAMSVSAWAVRDNFGSGTMAESLPEASEHRKGKKVHSASSMRDLRSTESVSV